MTDNSVQSGKIKTKGMSSRTRSRMLFYGLMIALPLTQWLVFYIGLNIKTFIMAFQKWSYADGALGYDISFAGLDNFKVALGFFKDAAYMVKNSAILAFCKVLVGTTLALIFSFYIYKKFAGAGLFKTLLFMPQMVSGLIFGLLFRYVANDVFVALFGHGDPTFLGLLDRSADVRFRSILVYDVFLSFGVNVLLFSGAMSGIDESLVESSKLDGANLMQEFIHITLPLIYPTIISFFIIGLSHIVTDQMHLYSMFGNNAKEIGTLGYYLYLLAKQGSEIVGENSGYYSYAELSAVSLLCTLVMVPTILTIKKLMTKLGPSVD